MLKSALMRYHCYWAVYRSQLTALSGSDDISWKFESWKFEEPEGSVTKPAKSCS